MRVRCIIRSICQEIPPPNVLNILRLLVTDGRYLPEGYLYEHEVPLLEFDEFGATRRMVFPKEDNNFTRSSSEHLDWSRCQMLFLSHVFLKTLLYRVVLTPWHAGVCRFPAPANLAHTVENLRHIASLIFMTVQRCDSSIPSPQKSNLNTPRAADESAWEWFGGLINTLMSRLLVQFDIYAELLDKNRPLYCDWGDLCKWLLPNDLNAQPELEEFIDECACLIVPWMHQYVHIRFTKR